MPTAQALPDWQAQTPDLACWTEDEQVISSWAEPKSQVPPTTTPARVADVFEKLDEEIGRAKRIVQLPDDWDGEGARGYSKETLDRALRFVSTHVRSLWETYGIEPLVPLVEPGPSGSIDIHWKKPTWELLVNIPADRNEMASFYGDDYNELKIRGTFDPEKLNLGIAEWLTH